MLPDVIPEEVGYGVSDGGKAVCGVTRVNPPSSDVPVPPCTGKTCRAIEVKTMTIWCDFNCPHASWPNEEGLDGSGSCRTFIAVYCKKYDELVAKNAPCLDTTKARKQKGPGKKKRKR